MLNRDSQGGALTISLTSMPFPDRLTSIRKERHLTQQALADLASLHVSMIRKYETGSGQPTLDALKRLAIALSVPTDDLVFDHDERGPSDDLRLQFEAASRLSPEEKKIIMVVIEGVLLQHETNEAATARAQRLAHAG